MSKAGAWMPLYIGDYTGDTLHLTTEQHGAYLLILMHQWRTGEPIPDDDEQLAPIARLSVCQWQRHRPVILKFFRLTHAGYVQPRLMEERRKAEGAVDKRSSAGKRGAEVRWKPSKKPDVDGGDSTKPNGQASGPANDEATGERMASACDGLWPEDAPSPSPSPLSKSTDSPKGESAPSAPEKPPETIIQAVKEPPPTAKQVVWRDGPAIVAHLTGLDDAKSRRFLGKLRSEVQDDCAHLLKVLHDAQRLHPLQNPEAWLIAAAQKRLGKLSLGAPFPTAAERREADLIASVKQLTGGKISLSNGRDDNGPPWEHPPI